MKTVNSIDGIIAQAQLKGPVPTAIVSPNDLTTMTAISEGIQANLIRAELFGDKEKIMELIKQVNIDEDTISIVDCGHNAVQAAVDSVRESKNKLLMKGSVSTPVLLKAVLDKTKGLNADRICCHIVVCEIPGWNRLLIISDGGLNVLPTLEQKVDIIKNTVELSHVLGIEMPKVALLASLEEVQLNIPATVDAAIITQMANRGQIKGAIVDGPLALDNIVSAESAKKKGIKSEVAGNADVIIVPSIEVGNVLGKCLGYFGGSINAGIVLGAKVPIILPSRAGKKEAKWASIALGVMMTK